jgi:cytokinesis protein
MEETRKRNEASMRRKHLNPTHANIPIDSGPPSPNATGAMDSLLEKLRAAAPQARDQRDRRRRARLKDRHQVRIASGQKIPDLPEVKSDVEDMLASSDGMASPVTSLPPIAGGVESEDVADRAANMLQGLRSDVPEGDTDAGIRMRRRRESADDERRARRRRRGAEGSQAGQGGVGTEESGARAKSMLVETREGEDRIQEHELEVGTDDGRDGKEENLPTPTTVIHPPSPDSAKKKTGLS